MGNAFFYEHGEFEVSVEHCVNSKVLLFELHFSLQFLS